VNTVRMGAEGDWHFDLLTMLVYWLKRLFLKHKS